jgi:hypothetical protein
MEILTITGPPDSGKETRCDLLKTTLGFTPTGFHWQHKHIATIMYYTRPVELPDLDCFPVFKGIVTR